MRRAEARRAGGANFFELGLGDPVPISAEHDRNVARLLDRALEDFPGGAPEDDEDEEPEAPTPRHIRVAIIGRPNAGKSTLLNRLTGAEHSIVSPIAGTTRDAVDVTVERDGVEFEFVDTAGIRRKGKTKEMAEKLSVVMAQRHLRMADVALMLLDAREGVTQVDAAIAGYAEEAGRAIILVVNKWDQVKGRDQADFRRELRDALKYLDYAPVIFISALTGSKTDSLFPLVPQGLPRIPKAHHHGRAQPLRRVSRLRPRNSEGMEEAPHLLRDPGADRTADVRLLHEPRRAVPLFVRALSAQSVA